MLRPRAQVLNVTKAPVWYAGLWTRMPSRRYWIPVALALLALDTLIGALALVGPSATDYLAAAASARASLRYDRALMWYTAASDSAPGEATPYCLEGEVLALQREWHAAIAADQRCVQLDVSRSSGWLALGDALSVAGNDAGAVGAWRHAAGLGSLTAWRRLGHDAESAGNFAGAQAAWDALPLNDPEALLHRGLLALERGNAPAARAAFVLLRAEPSQYAEFAVDNGFVVLSASDFSDPASLAQLGRAFLGANMPRLALVPFQQAAASAPDNGEVRALLGWTLWLLGRQSEAREQIALGPRFAPALSFVWFAAGQMALSTGDIFSASEDYQRGLALNPRNPVIWSSVAAVDTTRSDYISAELAYGNAAQLSTDPAYTILLLQFYVDHAFGYVGSRAVTAASAAVERFPRNEPIRFLQAEILQQASQPSFAFYACVAARQLDPTDPAPYLFLSSYALTSGDYVAAALDLRTALALRPAGPLAQQIRQALAPLGDIAR